MSALAALSLVRYFAEVVSAQLLCILMRSEPQGMKGVARGAGCFTNGFSPNISTNSMVNFHLWTLQNHQSVEYASARVFNHAIYQENNAQVNISTMWGCGETDHNKKDTDL